MEQSLSITLAQITILIIILGFAVVSSVLHYHWTRYGISEKSISKIKKIYFGVSSFLILLMVMSLIYLIL